MMVGHGDGDDCDGHSDYDDADVKQSACCGCLGGWAAVCCLSGSGGCAGLTEPEVVLGVTSRMTITTITKLVMVVIVVVKCGGGGHCGVGGNDGDGRNEQKQHSK